MEGFVGSSGTLIGSVLETVGYYYQSWLLDTLTGPFSSSVGAFVYIIGALMALTLVVVQGRYKLGAWFFLGPTLFFAVIIPRTETWGSDWQFGTEVRNRGQAQAEIDSILGKNFSGGVVNYPARVSSLFAVYNRLISRTVQELVRMIRGGDLNVDGKFLFKADLYAAMGSASVQEKPFRELLHLGLFRQCQQAVQYGRELRDPNFVKDEVVVAPVVECIGWDDDKSCNKFGVKTKCLKQGNDGQCLETEVVTAEMRAWENNVNKFNLSMTERKIQLSEEVLTWVAAQSVAYPEYVVAALSGGSKALTEVFTTDLQSGNPASGKMFSHYALEPLTVTEPKLQAAILNLRQNSIFSCNQVWNLILGQLYIEAARQLDGLMRQGQDIGLKQDELLKELLEPVGYDATEVGIAENKLDEINEQMSEKVDVLIHFIARKIFKNEVALGSTAAFMSDYISRGKELAIVEVPGDSDLAKIERERVEYSAWKNKTTLFTTAANLPYYQGFALYLLALLFPFFALLLLVPGKHSGFVLWFLLWMWVKSWDVGFAVVMMLDDLLYSIFAIGIDVTKAGGTLAMPADFSAALYALRQKDPTFNLSTYYNLIAVALSSVPVISSYLIIGSSKGGAGLIAQGIDGYSNPMSKAADLTQAEGVITGNMARAERMAYGAQGEFIKRMQNNPNFDNSNRSAIPAAIFDDDRSSGYSGGQMKGLMETATEAQAIANGLSGTYAGLFYGANGRSVSGTAFNQVVDRFGPGFAKTAGKAQQEMLGYYNKMLQFIVGQSQHESYRQSSIRDSVGQNTFHKGLPIPWNKDYPAMQRLMLQVGLFGALTKTSAEAVSQFTTGLLKTMDQPKLGEPRSLVFGGDSVLSQAGVLLGGRSIYQEFAQNSGPNQASSQSVYNSAAFAELRNTIATADPNNRVVSQAMMGLLDGNLSEAEIAILRDRILAEEARLRGEVNKSAARPTKFDAKQAAEAIQNDLNSWVHTGLSGVVGATRKWADIASGDGTIVEIFEGVNNHAKLTPDQFHQLEDEFYKREGKGLVSELSEKLPDEIKTQVFSLFPEDQAYAQARKLHFVKDHESRRASLRHIIETMSMDQFVQINAVSEQNGWEDLWQELDVETSGKSQVVEQYLSLDGQKVFKELELLVEDLKNRGTDRLTAQQGRRVIQLLSQLDQGEFRSVEMLLDSKMHSTIPLSERILGGVQGVAKYMTKNLMYGFSPALADESLLEALEDNDKEMVDYILADVDDIEDENRRIGMVQAWQSGLGQRVVKKKEGEGDMRSPGKLSDYLKRKLDPEDHQLIVELFEAAEEKAQFSKYEPDEKLPEHQPNYQQAQQQVSGYDNGSMELENQLNENQGDGSFEAIPEVLRRLRED